MNEAWAAGLFEGEGCITLHRGRSPRAALVSTDEDVVKRFAGVVGHGRVYGPYARPCPTDGRPAKPQWTWVAIGDDARVVLERLLPWLGERRRARATEVLALR